MWIQVEGYIINADKDNLSNIEMRKKAIAFRLRGSSDSLIVIHRGVDIPEDKFDKLKKYLLEAFVAVSSSTNLPKIIE